MKYQAVIFDLDGTIITTEDIWAGATKQLLKSKSTLSDQECHDLLPMLKGASLYTTCAFIKNTFSPPDTIEELIAQKEQLAFAQFQQHIKMIEGFDAFHHKLSQLGLKSAIATNSNQNSLDAVLIHVPLTQFFNQHIYSIDVVGKVAKPNPAIYLHAAQKLSIAPELCIAIEDSAHGINAAKAAGMFCVAINTGMDRHALAGADLIIDSYHELDPASFM